MPIAPQPVLHGPLADLLEWQAMAQGAYSTNTLRAQKADGAIFQAYCESVGEAFLPANPHTVRAFIYLLEASMDRRTWRRTRVQNSLRAIVAGQQK